MSEFARKQLEKYGWSEVSFSDYCCFVKFSYVLLLKDMGWKKEESKGLGKEESGIANPIKTTLKFDKQGIGHDNVKQLTSAWWCDMFNDAANRITVKNCEAGVNFSSKKSVINSNVLSPVLIHKNFVKGGTIKNSTEISSNSNEKPDKKSSIISDSIFKMCEGTKRTCDNYALTKGKIKRVRKQEILYEKECKRKNYLKSKQKKKYKKDMS